MLQQLTGEFVQGMPQDSLSKIESLAREDFFPPGATLFAEGAGHVDFHIIQQGHVRLEMHLPGRGRVPILSLGPGDVLAWSAVLSDEQMTATAIALDPVQTLAIPGARLRQLCEEEPTLGWHLMKQLAVALSRRLLATRLQLLDLFAEHQPAADSPAHDGGQFDQGPSPIRPASD